MKSSRGSYLLSLASAGTGALVGALAVAVPFVLHHVPGHDERVRFILKWIVPFVCAFTVLYGLADWFVRRKYLAIRRWTRGVFQGLL